MQKTTPPESGLRTFMTMWFGQTVSAFGTGLTRFVLGVYVYQLTGSVTQFAMILFATSLPGLVLLPVVGALVDRWDRRRAMIFSDTGAAVCTLAIAVLFYFDLLAVWHVYVILAIASVFQAFQWPAFSAATTLLVSKKQLGRVAGFRQLGSGTAEISAPLVAALLLNWIGLAGVIFIDFATFFIALTTLVIVRVPAPPKSDEPTAEAAAAKPSLLAEAKGGWQYLRLRPELFRLLALLAGVNLAIGNIQVLMTPLALSFTTATGLGTIMTVGSAGFLVGGLVMSAWGGPKRRMSGILVVLLLQGPVLLLAAWAEIPVLAAMMFLFIFGTPIANGCSQAIWQVKVAPDYQGRVFAIRRMIGQGALPVAYLIAGPLADAVFEPLMAEGGALAPIFGPWIGTGDGRGVALMFMLMGVVISTIAVAGYLNAPLRNLEDRLPDAIADDEPDDEPDEPAEAPDVAERDEGEASPSVSS